MSLSPPLKVILTLVSSCVFSCRGTSCTFVPIRVLHGPIDTNELRREKAFLRCFSTKSDTNLAYIANANKSCFIVQQIIFA